MEYKVVEAYDTKGLAILVQLEMYDGWKPCGSMSVKNGGAFDLDTYYQPMTREKK